MNKAKGSGKVQAGGGAKRRPAVPRPKLVSGLQHFLPAQPGPWLQQCIERWGLVAPYDPSVTEAQWESYFKERAALEWHTDSCIATVRPRAGVEATAGGGGAQLQLEEGTQAAEAWPFDWEKPESLRAFCREAYHENEAEELAGFLARMRSSVTRTAAGCKGVADAAALAASLGAGVYILSYWANWEDADEPRTLEIFSRIYSPCALGTSIDFGHRYHCRARICGDEYHAEANVEYRRAGACRQDEPQYASAPAEVYGKRKGNVLFRVCMMDSGYQNRYTPGVAAIKALSTHLLGRTGMMGQRKAFQLAALAAGTTAVPRANLQWLFRLNRRKHKLGPGEESEAASGDDCDSGNEALKPQKRPRYVGGLFEDFPDDDFDEWDEQAVLAREVKKRGYGKECAQM